MKFSLVLLTLWSVSATSAASSSFTPVRFSYDSLVSSSSDTPTSSTASFDNAALLHELVTNGIVSITGLPQDVKNAAQIMAATQHECLTINNYKQEQVFADGTLRRTMATQTVAGVGGMQDLKIDTSSSDSDSSDELSNACPNFVAASTVFRQATQRAVQAFARHVTQVLPMQDAGMPLLQTADKSVAFTTFSDVVVNGDHLEHFHSYTTPKSQPSRDNEVIPKTIDLHTDQGLFLVFTPGRLANGELTKGFFIETINGQLKEVAFDAALDELVFLLGDGVNQYVNDKLAHGQAKLRAVPHALQLEPSTEHQDQESFKDNAAANTARVWYGLMVLPPSSAVHPAYDFGITFGQIRQGLVQGNSQVVQLACTNTVDRNSLTDLDAFTTPRWLSEEGAIDIPTCNFTDEVYCWHRCMNATEYNLTRDTCTESGTELQCMNPRGQVSNGDAHGDFFPACAALDAPNVTEFDPLPNAPRDDTVCTDFMTTYTAGTDYANTMELRNKNNKVAALLHFNVIDGETMQARLAFDGILGYLGIGFVGPEYPEKNAMYGAPVILAMIGGAYSPVTGLDLSLGPTVDEFIISNEALSFRHWMTPYADAADLATGVVSTTSTRNGGRLNRNLGKATFKVETSDDECYTALSFEIHDIGGQHFNTTGTDYFQWAANTEDIHMQYHGEHQGIFNITWADVVPTVGSTADSAANDKDKDPAATTNGSSAAVATTKVGAAAVTLALLVASIF